jgi:hypothetical protein
VWFGGYLILLLGLPSCLSVCSVSPTLKKSGRRRAGERHEKNKLPADVLYYGAITLRFC